MKKLGYVLLLFAGSLSAATWQSSPLRENGTIQKWLIAGPFPNGDSGSHGRECVGYFKDFLVAQGGETKALPVEGDPIQNSGLPPSIWLRTSSESSGIVDFLANFAADGQTPYVAYAYTQLASDREQKVLLRARSNDGIRIWLNGEMVHDHHIGRRIDAEEDRVNVTLKKGDNTLLCKVDQSGGGWGLLIKADATDESPLKGVTSKIPTNPSLSGKILSTTLNATQMIVRTPDGERQIITGVIRSGGLRNAVCTLSKAEWQKPLRVKIGDITPGLAQFELKAPVIQQDGDATVIIESARDRKVFENVPLKKARPWVVYIVQHTHTDIGYTRPQNEMLAEYFRYIDWALDYCDQTDGYPDDAKFRWTCETSWAVQEYVKTRPQKQIERLRKRVQEGRIEVTGMFLNWSELADETVLAASLQPIREIREQGLPIVSGMQCDVNGAAWCLPDYLSDIGVKYFIMGINHDHAALQFPRPTPFWWESPSGKRVLAFQADHYMTANAFMNTNSNAELTRNALSSYLDKLERKQYPYDRIGVQLSGYDTDNSPPAAGGSEVVKKWNKAYVWPKLRIATVHEYLSWIEEKHGTTLPAYRAAWPDWWTDGGGSAARETAAARTTQSQLLAAEGALALAAASGADIKPVVQTNIQSAQEAVLYYDEHTFGASESINDPDCENSMAQWQQKAAFVWQAVKETGIAVEQALGFLQTYLPRDNVPTLAVINTLNWPRSGVTRVFIDRDVIPPDQPMQFISDDHEIAPAQIIGRRAEGSYWLIWTKDIPAMGYKTFRIEKKPVTSTVAPTDNPYYNIKMDPATGAITSLFDKQLGRELVDQKSPWHLAQLIYEQVADRSKFMPESFARSTLHNVRVEPGPVGPMWQSIKIFADAEGCASSVQGQKVNGVTVEIRLYTVEKRIEFLFSVRKLPILTPEAIYVTFPFVLDNGKIVYEGQGGLIMPGKNQIRGSAADYQTVQNFVAVRNQNSQIIWGSEQAPMVMFDDFNFGKWQDTPHIEKLHIYSYVLNNYWHTNFPARQEGEIKWSYYLTSLPDTSNTQATRFGWGSRVPLLGRVLLPGAKMTAAPSQEILKITPDNVLLVNARPANHESGLILHLREVEGREASVAIQHLLSGKKIVSLEEVNLLEESNGPFGGRLLPFESKFIRVKM